MGPSRGHGGHPQRSRHSVLVTWPRLKPAHIGDERDLSAREPDSDRCGCDAERSVAEPVCLSHARSAWYRRRTTHASIAPRPMPDRIRKVRTRTAAIIEGSFRSVIAAPAAAHAPGCEGVETPAQPRASKILTVGTSAKAMVPRERSASPSAEEARKAQEGSPGSSRT